MLPILNPPPSQPPHTIPLATDKQLISKIYKSDFLKPNFLNISSLLLNQIQIVSSLSFHS